ncbi:MAG: hypothetical protein CMQ43_12490 [Gammaproteobacteria bacterium]|nr:hypothetical protein [Gammaproteobacteria bacterium]MBK81717.1 hypothetical protein [Gammaproteobacteria bacterium]|tara:strand:- start:8209 stop:8877 length:669 start_codon:yes stop_codon:yes gene_type:complete
MNTTSDLSFEGLKQKQRDIRAAFPEDLGLRVHRAISWLHRAEMAGDDHDAAFIFYWIAFNAAYANELKDSDLEGERSVFADYFARLTGLDRNNRIYDVIWERFPQEIRLLLQNRYVFQPFWRYQNGQLGGEQWETSFDRSQRRVARALKEQDTKTILSTLFDRLYVLRNQLVHGGATWNSQVNRDQVRDGARILAVLVPVFVDLMMDNPDATWGAPYYPVVE